MRTVITIIAVGIGSIIGSAIAGGIGWFIGAVLAYGACLLGFEKADTNRPVDGFWLRYRGHLLVAACILIGMTVGISIIGGWFGWLAGFGGGWFLGNWLGNAWGWSGESQEAAINIRLAYVSVLASAAKADGVLSDKEAKEIIRATKELFTSVGYGSNQDVEEFFNAVKDTNHSHQEIIDLMRLFPPEIHNALQFDLLRVLFASGTPSEASQSWLDFVVSSGVFSDWSVLQFFTRSAPGSNSRASALQELELDSSATPEDIKRAYRVKAQEYHPDKLHNVPPQIRALAEAKMAAINSAYQELIGTKTDVGNYFFRTEDTTHSFPISAPSAFVCTCWLCVTKNRIPEKANPRSARCGECHALLGLDFDPLQ
jgi:DnaJ like chaperone protein